MPLDDSIPSCSVGAMDPLVHFAIYALLSVIGQVAIIGGILWLIYFLLTLPVRRGERARLFLHLLELGIRDGHRPEQAVLEAVTHQDRSPGPRLKALARHLQSGLRLSESLQRVPGLLPPQIVAMLSAGERAGDITKVLPACRLLLRDGISQTRGALNYLPMLTFVVTPFTILVPLVLNTLVLPKFKEVFIGMLPGQTWPAFSRVIFDWVHPLILAQTVLLALFWLAIVTYIGGPPLRRTFKGLLCRATDRVIYLLPWRRKRLQRDFSGILAVLLDSGLPEAEAVTLAGSATANVVVEGRAQKVAALLRSGAPLPSAIHALDRSAELRWRLANALRGGHGFLRALSGWHEALDAKAFQLEQAAAQITTTTLVLLNGAVIASIIIAVFLLLIDIINSATVW